MSPNSTIRANRLPISSGRLSSRRWRRFSSALGSRAPLVLVTLQLATLVALVVMLPKPAPQAAPLLLILLIATSFASTVRIGERSHLGLGAIYLPAVAFLGGTLAVALGMAIASAASDRLGTLLQGRFPDAPPERRLRSRRLHDLLGVCLAAAGAAAVSLVTSDGRSMGRWVGAALAYVLLLSLHEYVSRLKQRSGPGLLAGPAVDGSFVLLGGMIFDGLGGREVLSSLSIFSGAGSFADELIGAFALLALLSVVSGLALTLSAQQRRIAHLVTRLSKLDSIGSAPRRMGSARRRQADVVASVVDEIRRLIDFDYLRLDIDSGDSVWSARRGEPPIHAPVSPPPHPPPRPGIHRRRKWTLYERTLWSGELELGALKLWCDPRRQGRAGLEVLDHLSEQVAALLERARLAQEARFDRLTGLPRRGIFDDELERRWTRARENGGPLAVVLIDVDHFKSVNDTYGHPVGDQVLVFVANTLSSVVRDEDLCCRYGGEEFVLLLAEADGERALEMAERTRQAIESKPFRARDVELHLTASAGAAAVPELLLPTSMDLVEMADEALYAAKTKGRNRCYLAVGKSSYRGVSGRVIHIDAASDGSDASDVTERREGDAVTVRL